MKKFIIYNKYGVILRIVACPLVQLKGQCSNNEWCIRGDVDDRFYYVDVNTHRIARKKKIRYKLNKASIKADQADELVISDLPVPCVVTVEGQEYHVDDGLLELTVDHVGTYPVTIRAQHYLDKEFSFEGTA